MTPAEKTQWQQQLRQQLDSGGLTLGQAVQRIRTELYQMTQAEYARICKVSEKTLREVEKAYADYRFDLASQALYEFAWNEFCDWFLELAKPALHAGKGAAADSTRHTLLFVLEGLLRALHPVIPFVTEEIWHSVAPKLGITADTISTQAWPEVNPAFDAPDAAADIEWLKAAVTQLRSIRSQMNIAPSKAVPLLLQGGDATDRARTERYTAALTFLARLESIAWHEGEAPASAAAVLGDLKLLIPLEGLIDLGAEKARLDKELKRIAGELAKCEAKLGNETFVANAPAAVVEQERARLADWANQHAALQAQRAKLGALQSRFETTVGNLQITSENLSASRSRIQDADFAAETAALSRAQILQQAGTAMVAQANQIPQGVLQLLQG